MTAEDSGNWLIWQLADEAALAGDPLTDEELKLLRTPMWDFDESHKSLGLSLNNRLVPLARRRMERAKAEGAPTVKVRRGLRIPQEWQEHYALVFTTELPLPISGIMQNAMMANPMAGERKPWKSK